MIPRPQYLSKAIEFIGTDFVKVITGVRRCGKSTLLRMLAEHLIASGVPQGRCIPINFESALASDLKDSGALHSYIRQRIEHGPQGDPADGPFYVMIDEVQEIDLWASVVNSLKATFPVDLYVTGSNSRLFVGEDLTYLSGRYVEIRMYPLSFEEYLHFRGLLPDGGNSAAPASASLQAQKAHQAHHPDCESALNEYLSCGSFPAVALAEGKPELVQAITQGLIDSVVMRDMVQRGNIDNDALFQRVAQFMFGNIGSEVSANKIARTLKSAGHAISANTVDRYIKLMCDAFVFYPCRRYDIRGKEHLRLNGKYYVVDMGLRNAFLGERPRDFGHVLENIVFLELLRRGFEVTVGKIGTREVDFIAVRQTDRRYIQVCQSLAAEDVQAREFAALEAISDAYPKYVLSLDRIDYSRGGIRHINLISFLLDSTIF